MPSSRRAWLAARTAFGLAGITFLVVAFRATVSSSDAQLVPDPLSAAGTLGAALAGLLFGALSWGEIVGRTDTAVLRGFVAAQLGKYIPGGIWPTLAQVGSATGAGIPLARASVAFPIHVLTQVAAAGAMGASLVFLSRAPGAPQWVFLGGLLALPLLHRRWMVFVISLIPRFRARDIVPAQHQIRRSFAWGLATTAAGGASFALIAITLAPDLRFSEAAPAWILAWAVGLLALPIPSGIGVRESILILLLGHAAPTSALIAASAWHRAATMAAEASLLGWLWWRGKRQKPPVGATPPG